jgi:glycosyltransferase 2 family protein
MVTHERLVRLASKGAELANTKRVRLVAHLLLLGGLVFLAVRLRSIVRDSDIHLTSSGWAWLAAATLLGALAVIASSFIWLVILRRLGMPVRWRSAAIYLQAQLAKYVPGGVWQYASRGTMARVHGLSVRVVARSLPIELAATLYAGAAFTFLIFGWWGSIAVAAAIAAAPGLAPYLAKGRPAVLVAAQTVPLYAATWLLIGASFWMTARAFVPVSPSDLPLYTGAFAAAWIVGLIAIYAPGGIGVREAILVAILGSRIGSAEALVVAAASRAVFTVADLVPAALSLPLLRRRHHLAAEPAPPA